MASNELSKPQLEAFFDKTMRTYIEFAYDLQDRDITSTWKRDIHQQTVDQWTADAIECFSPEAKHLLARRDRLPTLEEIQAVFPLVVSDMDTSWGVYWGAA